MSHTYKSPPPDSAGYTWWDFIEYWHQEQINYRSMSNADLLLCYAMLWHWQTFWKDGRTRGYRKTRKVSLVVAAEIMSRMTTPSSTPPE